MLWRKLVTPTVAVSLLWLGVGGATIYYLDWLYDSHSRDLAENFTTIQAADAMQDVLWQLQATTIEVAERADSHTRTEVAELELTFEGHLATAAGSATPEARALVAAIREQFSEYRQRIHTRLNRKSSQETEEVLATELSRSAHSIAQSCKSLLKIQEALIAESTAQRGRLRVAFGRIMFTLWIVGPTVGILLGLWIAHRLQRSISRISISLKDAADGLDREVGCVDVVPSDDLPTLQEQVQQVSSRIRQVVDELQQARRETMLADRLAAVGEMAAGIAHELRNPLTSVKLLMQTAADEPAGETLTSEHIHVVLEQVIRMENSIQGLLDFARPPRMQKVRHDLRDTLQRALNLVEGYAKQQGVAVCQECWDTPVLVDGDPEQLHQVFVNLLLNGVEAMPDGGQLRIAVRRLDAASPVGTVSFCDNGSGIPESIMPRIFEPFVTSKERGTGLGLAISRRILEQHGGKLTATNREPCGAVFTVELPLSTKHPDPVIASGSGDYVMTQKAIDAQVARR
jgi:two-component system, NtrC family, sensor histidine kinase HydH